MAPRYGQATIYTNTRKGYSEVQQRGSVAESLVFSLDMESTLMGEVLDKKIKPNVAAKAWLKQNRRCSTHVVGGRDNAGLANRGLEAVKASLAQ